MGGGVGSWGGGQCPASILAWPPEGNPPLLGKAPGLGRERDPEEIVEGLIGRAPGARGPDGIFSDSITEPGGGLADSPLGWAKDTSPLLFPEGRGIYFFGVTQSTRHIRLIEKLKPSQEKASKIFLFLTKGTSRSHLPNR